MARHLMQRFLLTLPALWLVLTLVCAAIAIPSGVLAAHRRGQAADRAVGGLSFVRLR
jgi:ABC-type dipeptide/oligopeptide/nickel transport system permease component